MHTHRRFLVATAIEALAALLLAPNAGATAPVPIPPNPDVTWPAGTVCPYPARWAGFRAAVFTLRSLEAQGPRVLEHAIEHQQTQMIEARMQLQAERTEARARLERVETWINAELTTP